MSECLTVLTVVVRGKRERERNILLFSSLHFYDHHLRRSPRSKCQEREKKRERAIVSIRQDEGGKQEQLKYLLMQNGRTGERERGKEKERKNCNPDWN